MWIDYAGAASHLYGREPFTLRDFELRTGSPRGAKTLSELKMRGLAERVGRGRYRMLGPEERPDLRAAEWSRVRHVLLGSRLPMAWAGSSAVSVWTRGSYTVSPSVFVREFHIDVPRGSMGRWLEYLRDNRVSTDPRRRIGSKVIISPKSRLRRVFHRGEPVIPRETVLALIRAHRGIYADADKLVEHGA
jgi:hypothetical protein